MTELASVTLDRSFDVWDIEATEDTVIDLPQYIVSPDPLPDSHFDEGEGD